jgi:hypothetical protein
MTEKYTPADLSRLMNNARVYLPGALDNALKLELFNVLDEFFQGSNSWQDTATIQTTLNKTSYTFDVGEPAAIVRLISLVDPNGSSVPSTMSIAGTLVLNASPVAAQQLVATLSLTVVDPVDQDNYPRFPGWLLNKYGSDILDGLLGRMMGQPAKPYSSERLSVYHLRRFRDGIAKAKSEARHQNLFSGQRWTFPKFASGRQRR